MSLSSVFGLEAAAVGFELPCNQECSSLCSPRKRSRRYRSEWTQAFYGPGKKDWEMGLWFGVVEIFGNLTGDGLRGYVPRAWSSGKGLGCFAQRREIRV
ncbi:hypothetical protein OIU79_005051 [Salix purpurea]|uniref:Uncharacterized protein n=1 Tax=Salix purpurea TaxID=77065 RepID=A0A9Q0ZA84_SALPP|nr:hypothetical protein OIU79_005051 [Salix purpurea]